MNHTNLALLFSEACETMTVDQVYIDAIRTVLEVKTCGIIRGSDDRDGHLEDVIERAVEAVTWWWRIVHGMLQVCCSGSWLDVAAMKWILGRHCG